MISVTIRLYLDTAAVDDLRGVASDKCFLGRSLTSLDVLVFVDILENQKTMLPNQWTSTAVQSE